MKEQEWPFPFYDVDCSKDYAFCKQAVGAKSFPFVGIFDVNGKLEAKFTGYYPIDVIRDTLKDISSRQQYVLKQQSTGKKSDSKDKTSETSTKIESKEEVEHLRPVLLHKNKEIQNAKAKDHHVSEPKTEVEVTPNAEEHERWTSITIGVQVLIVLLGYWWFQVSVFPYLKYQISSEEGKSKIIELPVNRPSDYSRVKQEEETSNLMSDTL